MSLTQRQVVILQGLVKEASMREVLQALAVHAADQSILATQGLDRDAPYDWAKTARAIEDAYTSPAVLRVSRK